MRSALYERTRAAPRNVWRGRMPALPASTIRSIRPGYVAAITIPIRPPLEWPIRSHVSTPSRSSSAMHQAA